MSKNTDIFNLGYHRGSLRGAALVMDVIENKVTGKVDMTMEQFRDAIDDIYAELEKKVEDFEKTTLSLDDLDV